MNNGWVKLHRKTLDNGILKDHTAWVVFSWFLMMVDKETGKRTFGRFQLSDELGIKPNTLYKVVKRLEKKYKVIKVLSQTNYTEVLVVNWGKYQHQETAQSNDSQTTVKPASTISNTKQELENREYKNREYLTTFSLKDFSDIEATEKQLRLEGEKAYNWCLSKGKVQKNYKAFLRNWVLKAYKKKVFLQPVPQYEINPDGLAKLKNMKEKFNLN